MSVHMLYVSMHIYAFLLLMCQMFNVMLVMVLIVYLCLSPMLIVRNDNTFLTVEC